ncbi:hypothetical protein [Pseudomonas koreensis]|uniref:F4 family fimbrial subunit n=1 Tax=Pseudomonas koreensis TaxID=198620 RepID=UPI001B31F78E|nr:hypothetical protein [Pseudomonas koreensis]MBP4002556.1 hypothetical protein [Pseudomonas koreensis]
MTMTKSLLTAALAAATLGVAASTMALTFTDGGLTGSIEINGTVDAATSTNYWQWAAGDAISFPAIPVTQMTNNYKTLTLHAASNLPLLVGQTKAATMGSFGNVGLNPQITFTNAAGFRLTPVWDNTGNTGTGTITLPVTAADGITELGSMSMRVKVGAVRAETVMANGTTELFSTSVTVGSDVTLYGEEVQPSPAGALATGSSAAGWNAVLGAKSSTDLRDQLNAASGLSTTTWAVDSLSNARGFSSLNYYSGSYGLGIAQGADIVVTFTDPITVTTFWKAPLNMMVTYL